MGGLKWAAMESNRAKTTCFGIPRGPGTFLNKVSFLPQVDPVDPFW